MMKHDSPMRWKTACLAGAAALVALLAGCGGGGSSDPSDDASAAAQRVRRPRPSAPANLVAAAAGATQVDLAWNAGDAAAAYYQVFRDGEASPFATTSGTSFSDATAAPGAMHVYQVRAVNSAGAASDLSAPAQATLAGAEGQTKSVLVIHTVFTDTPSCFSGTQQMRDAFFDAPGSVKDFFLASSYGTFTWTGDVMMCRVSYASTDGSRNAEAECQARARARGLEPDAYDVLGFISNRNGDAGSSGRQVGSWNCDLSFMAHELGHQAGVGHASSDWDNDGVLDDEYGDHADVMGWGYWTLNVPHRAMRGWLSPAVLRADGTYRLAPVELTSGIRGYRLDLAGGDPYFFGYYQPMGVDAAAVQPHGYPFPEGVLGSTPYSEAYANGLNVYRHDGQSNTRIVMQIGDGQSYEIPGTSVVIRQLSHDSDGVTFTVSGLTASAAP